jgi:hypothetical protein
MDMVIDGTPDLTGPVKNPPRGVSAIFTLIVITVT